MILPCYIFKYKIKRYHIILYISFINKITDAKYTPYLLISSYIINRQKIILTYTLLTNTLVVRWNLKKKSSTPLPHSGLVCYKITSYWNFQDVLLRYSNCHKRDIYAILRSKKNCMHVIFIKNNSEFLEDK
jgi:hypothetical protein